MACSETSIVIDSLIRHRAIQSVLWYLYLTCTSQTFVVITGHRIPLTFVYACSPIGIATYGSRQKATVSSKIPVSHPWSSTMSIRFSIIMLTTYASSLPSGNSNFYALVSSIGFLCSSPIGLPKAFSFLSFYRARTGMKYLPGTTTLNPI